MSSKKSCIQIYRLVEAVFPAASSLRRRIFIGATHPWGLATPLTFKFLVGEFVHLSSLFELLYFIRSLRHQKYKFKIFRGHQVQIHIIQGSENQIQIRIFQGVRAPNTNTHYSGVREPNTNTHFSGDPRTKYKYAFFRGSKHQIQIHIIQRVRAPNKNTHYSGDPSTKWKYTLFRGSEHQIQIHIIQGSENQIQIRIFQGVRAPNTNTHFSGGPSTKYKYTLFRGSEHQIQIHIIQGVRAPDWRSSLPPGAPPGPLQLKIRRDWWEQSNLQLLHVILTFHLYNNMMFIGLITSSFLRCNICTTPITYFF